MGTIDLSPLRKHFPALNKEFNGKKRIYLDGAGGTQMPQSVVDAMVDYMINDNGNYRIEKAITGMRQKPY